VTAFDAESDTQLVELAQASGNTDTRAFETLVRRHQGHVVANCRILTRSSADAEDLAQEVFVKAFFGLRRFEGRAQFRTWLQRVKVNHCLNHLRKMRRGTEVGIDDVTPEDHDAMRTPATAHTDLQTAADRARIVAVLDTLSDTLRVPLMLRDGDGLSYEEIATSLGISLSAVKMRIKRAREEFRVRYATPQPVSSPQESATLVP
jgi:RNA polymerase sigma-70 factor (ECF subfamily)